MNTNQWGDPLPQIISTISWVESSSVVDPYKLLGVDYKQLLCCDTTPVADMWPCEPLPTGAALTCDPFTKVRIWSPRRSHVALAVSYTAPGDKSPSTYIVVLGKSRAVRDRV